MIICLGGLNYDKKDSMYLGVCALYKHGYVFSWKFPG